MLLTSKKWQTHIFHVIDTPGHADFVDEIAAAMRLVDGAIFVVDVVDGVNPAITIRTFIWLGVLQMSHSAELILRHLVDEHITFVVLINKLDRLILELCLRPADAYLKIVHTIEAINTFLWYLHSFYSSMMLIICR